MQRKEYDNAVEKLEFRQILEMTAGYSHSENSKLEILSMPFLSDDESVERSQTEIEELLRVAEKGITLPMSDWADSSDVLRRISVEGSMLSGEELAVVASAEKTARRVKSFLESRAQELPLVSGYAKGMTIVSRVIDEVSATIGDDFSCSTGRVRGFRE